MRVQFMKCCERPFMPLVVFFKNPANLFCHHDGLGSCRFPWIIAICTFWQFVVCWHFLFHQLKQNQIRESTQALRAVLSWFFFLAGFSHLLFVCVITPITHIFYMSTDHKCIFAGPDFCMLQFKLVSLSALFVLGFYQICVHFLRRFVRICKVGQVRSTVVVDIAHLQHHDQCVLKSQTDSIGIALYPTGFIDCDV